MLKKKKIFENPYYLASALKKLTARIQGKVPKTPYETNPSTKLS